MRQRKSALAVALLALVTCDDGPPSTQPGSRVNPADLLEWRAPNVTAIARPVVDGTTVYFLTYEGHVVTAVEKSSGRVLWRKQLGFTNPPDGLDGGYGLALAGGMLVVGDIEVFGLNRTTGEQVWNFATPSEGRKPGYSRLTSDGITVFPASNSGHVYGVDAATGNERWATKIDPAPNVDVWNPVFDRGVVFAGFRIRPPNSNMPFKGGVAAVDATNGQLLWSRVVPQPDSAGQTAVESVATSGDLVFAGSADGNVYVFDRLTGALRNTLTRSLFVPTATGGLETYRIATVGSKVIVGTSTGVVTALDAATLTKQWQASSSRSSVYDLWADNQMAFASHAGGELGVFRLTDGNVLWSLDRYDLRTDGHAGGLYAPVSDGNLVFVGGTVESYAFRRQ